MPLRKLPNDYHNLAESRGMKWLGPEVPNVKTKTSWECNSGHHWESIYDNVRRGNSCPRCTIERLSKRFRLKPSNYYELAGGRGFEWLGPEVPKNSIKTWWKCPEGHEWEATYGSIQMGSGCPHCSSKARKTKKDYCELARTRGFEWIGKELPGNVFAKSLWCCSRGHEWETCYSSVQSGYGCPVCDDRVNGIKVSAPQRQVCNIVKGELNYLVGSCYIDIALVDNKIAIEYDSWYWHGGREKYDMRRNRELLDAGWKILRIKANTCLPSKQKLEEAILELENGKVYTEIILGEWGKGPTFINRKNSSKYV